MSDKIRKFSFEVITRGYEIDTIALGKLVEEALLPRYHIRFFSEEITEPNLCDSCIHDELLQCPGQLGARHDGQYTGVRWLRESAERSGVMQTCEKTCATCFDGVGDKDKGELYCLPRQETVSPGHTCEMHVVGDRGEVENV